MAEPIELPWKPQKTRQVIGRTSEKKQAKKYGLRLHPNSGAGHIKWDASDDERLVEMKDAKKTITVNGEYLDKLFRDAVRQGKDAIFIINFVDANVVLEAQIRRASTS